MEELHDLVRIISQERIKKIDILNNPDTHKDGRSRISQLYHGIRSGKVRADEDARLTLGYQKGDGGYPIFKYRFRRMLYNSLFFIDMSTRGLSDYDRAANECSRAQHQVRVLIWFYARQASAKLCETMLAKAEKFDLAEYAVFFLRKLIQSDVGRARKHEFDKHSAALRFWLKRWQAEENAIMAFYNLEIAYAKTITRQPLAAMEALKAATDIHANLKTQDSYIIRLHLYRLCGIGNYILGRFQLSNDAWSALDNYLQTYPQFKANVRLGEIALQQMPNYLHLDQYHNGIECALRCLQYFGKESINRIIFYEYYFLMLMHGKRYKEARIIYHEVYKADKFRELPDFQQQKWILFDAWLYFALGQDGNFIKPKPFKISRTINEIRALSTDKKGLNISQLIIEICILFRDWDFNTMISKMQALKLYKERYIRLGFSKRTQIFIKMLLILEECNYDSKKAKIAVIPWMQKLQDTPFRYSGELEGLEVIRFDTLWDIILNFAKENEKK